MIAGLARHLLLFSNMKDFFISDLLANYHDWDCDDPRSDFLTAVERSFPEVSKRSISSILEDFENLDPLLRFDPTFDHLEFVRSRLRDPCT